MQEVEHMDIELRLETPADYAETEKVVREAFWNVYAPGCTEHYLVHVMRSSENFVRELAFVAVADSKIVGCVMFVKGTIAGDDGVVREVLTLGPIAVLPAYQKKGVGRRLIDHARKEAIRQGYAANVLCGDPLYYSRVGFEPAENFGIRTADNKYFVALQICPLQEKRPESYAGRYSDDAVYNISQEAAFEFDQQFPPKDRLENTPTQKRLLEIIEMQRPFDGAKR